MIEESEKGTSARKIAEIFKCGRTQINGIIKNKDEILKEWEKNMRGDFNYKIKPQNCNVISETGVSSPKYDITPLAP